MADAQDLKSWGPQKPCGFKSHHRHHSQHPYPEMVRESSSSRSGPLGIATTDGNSDVTGKRRDQGIPLRFIQRPRLGVVTSRLQDDRVKTAAANLCFQVPQDLSRNTAASRIRSDEHALDFNAPLIDGSKPTAAHGLIRFSRDHEISASLFKFGYIDPIDRGSWDKGRQFPCPTPESTRELPRCRD